MIPDYQTPVAEIPIPPRVRWLRTIILLMGWGWVIASKLAGISGDRVTIPLPKKIALTLSASIIAGLLLWADRNQGGGMYCRVFLLRVQCRYGDVVLELSRCGRDLFFSIGVGTLLRF